VTAILGMSSNSRGSAEAEEIKRVKREREAKKRQDDTFRQNSNDKQRDKHRALVNVAAAYDRLMALGSPRAIITSGLYIGYPDVVLDPSASNIMELIWNEVFRIGFAFVGIAPAALALINSTSVQSKLLMNGAKKIYSKKNVDDDERVFVKGENSWMLTLCPYLEALTSDSAGGCFVDTTVMRIGRHARLQDLHMDSGPVPPDVWEPTAVRVPGTGFTRAMLKDEYKYMPLEILVALNDDAVTRVCPFSQWINSLSDFERSVLQMFERRAIRMGMGVVMISHPNVVHSGMSCMYGLHDFKIHSKLRAQEGATGWVPAPWTQNSTFIAADTFPRLAHLFE
jgi:hypothetical protein